MTNLTLQPYSTKLAKHQPPDLRNPTEKGESAGLQNNNNNNNNNNNKKGGSNLLQTLQPSTAGYSPVKKKYIYINRACPRGTAGGEREQFSPLDGQR